MDEQNPSITDAELPAFLSRNRISSEDWSKADISWELLQAIGADHDLHRATLNSSAEFFAGVIQRFNDVHSVRWRVKDTDHLLEKIIRKRAKGAGKYAEIDATNYFSIVTDLVGIRALHLFKDEVLTIDQQVREAWALSEKPIAYVRAGDPQDWLDKFTEVGFSVENHPDNYRSVHYVCETQPMQRRVFAEIQVRTIFEEGWSEIDHRVRYPNFSDNQQVSYFLAIFNRLAGSADEMGTFVKGLTQSLQQSAMSLSLANKEKEDALGAMEKLLADLDILKKQDADAKTKLDSLQREVSRLRRISTEGDHAAASDRRSLESLFPHGGLGLDSIGGNALRKLALAGAPGEVVRKLAEEHSKNDLARLLGKANLPKDLR